MPSGGLFTVTDADLVRRVLAGELDAYGELMARHGPRLGRYAYHMLGDRMEAEEAVQDAFVRAHRGLDRADPDRFGAWIFRILANRCRTRRARRRRSDRTVIPMEQPPEAPAPRTTDDGGAWREEIQRALATLPADQREAFLLKHVEELSYEEMERVTGAGTSALKMRVMRACERLRDQLEDVYHD